MFISLSITRIQNFSERHALFVVLFFFFITFCSRCGMGCKIPRVDPQMALFQLFLSPGAQNNLVFVYFRQLKKNNILGIHPKKVIIPAPFHSKTFALLYKSETSWELLGRLSRSYFSAISGASNFKHSLFLTLSRLGLLTM